MNFATKLKQARHDAGLTQRQLADLLGITPQTLRNWESGRTVPPTDPVLTQGDVLRAIKAD
jgi:transcriptional regulator with XRE-family HTH domain